MTPSEPADLKIAEGENAVATAKEEAHLGYFYDVCSRNPEYQRGANGKAQCPCCLAFTNDEGNTFEICPVCNWEDDGAVEDSQFGGPNGMTLGDGRANFKQHGCSNGQCSRPGFNHDGKHYPCHRQPAESELAAHSAATDNPPTQSPTKETR